MSKNNSFSINSKNIEEFKKLLEEKEKKIGKPTLAILFVNADLDIEGIHKYLDEREIAHIGASSYGELSNDGTYFGVYTGLFMYVPKEYFKIYHSQNEQAVLLGKELGIFAKNNFENPAIYMLIASKDSQTDLYVKDVQKETNNNIPLYGGHALDNLKFEKYTVFSNNYISNNGVVAVVFDSSKIEIYGDSYSGWDSIGKVHTITKSRGNELLEIDGRPALDLFVEYFDYFDLEKAAKGEDSEFIIGNHPIKVIEEQGGTSLKSPIEFDLNKRSMTYYCSVPVGTKFKFCTNPKIEITDNLISRIKEIRVDVNDLDCVLITSCASRQLVLGPFFKKEMKGLYEIWNKPMAGFLSGGEIGNVKESNESFFHNVTCVFTGFKTK